MPWQEEETRQTAPFSFPGTKPGDRLPQAAPNDGPSPPLPKPRHPSRPPPTRLENTPLTFNFI